MACRNASALSAPRLYAFIIDVVMRTALTDSTGQ